MIETNQTSEENHETKNHETSGCACEPHELGASEPRAQEIKRPRADSRTHVPLPGRVPIVRHRKRASPLTVIASERKMMSEERRLARKASRRRSPTPTSMLPDEPSAPKTTEDIATAGKVVVGLSTNNQEHEEVAALGELMDADHNSEI